MFLKQVYQLLIKFHMKLHHILEYIFQIIKLKINHFDMLVKYYKNPDHIYRGPSTFSSANILMGTCIDHIFATSNVTSLYHSLIIDEDALSASDHAPIYSDLKF